MAHSIVAVEVSDIQVCLPSRYTDCRNSITYKHLRLKSSLVKILLGLDMTSPDRYLRKSKGKLAIQYVHVCGQK